jgi:hypothetical protein
MKRLAWLFLAVFCAAMVQVQPVRGLPVKVKACNCCQVPGTCGMPDCCPPSAFASTVLGSEESVRLALPASRTVAAIRDASVVFYAAFVEPAIIPPALSAALAAAPARVPLFKAHCSFLI